MPHKDIILSLPSFAKKSNQWQPALVKDIRVAEIGSMFSENDIRSSFKLQHTSQIDVMKNLTN